MNLDALLDTIPHDDREWLRRHRSDVVPADAPESVVEVFRQIVERIIDPER